MFTNARAATTSLLHGVSQIFLARSVLAGITFLVAIASYSVPMAGFVLLGTAATTLVGWGFAGTEELPSLRDGLLGYNGALIGAASYVSWPDLGPALGATLVGALAGAGLTRLGTRFVALPGLRRWGLPVLTAPFCIASGILTFMGAHYLPPASLESSASAGVLRDAMEILFKSISQVVLADSELTGALLLLGLFLAGWRIGLAGLGGAVGALLFVTVTGQDVISMRQGLLGFSGVLVAIALGVTFIRGSAAKRIVVAAIGILIAELIAVTSAQWPFPAYTWPFIIATWLMIVLVRALELRGVIPDPDRVEDHRG